MDSKETPGERSYADAYWHEFQYGGKLDINIAASAKTDPNLIVLTTDLSGSFREEAGTDLFSYFYQEAKGTVEGFVTIDEFPPGTPCSLRFEATWPQDTWTGEYFWRLEAASYFERDGVRVRCQRSVRASLPLRPGHRLCRRAGLCVPRHARQRALRDRRTRYPRLRQDSARYQAYRHEADRRSEDGRICQLQGFRRSLPGSGAAATRTAPRPHGMPPPISMAAELWIFAISNGWRTTGFCPRSPPPPHPTSSLDFCKMKLGLLGEGKSKDYESKKIYQASGYSCYICRCYWHNDQLAL